MRTNETDRSAVASVFLTGSSRAGVTYGGVAAVRVAVACDRKPLSNGNEVLPTVDGCAGSWRVRGSCRFRWRRLSLFELARLDA